MEEIGDTIMTKSQYAAMRFSKIPGVKVRFTGTFFKEFVLDYKDTGKSEADIRQSLLEEKIFSGVALKNDYPELSECALVCVTEMTTMEAIDHMAEALERAVQG